MDTTWKDENTQNEVEETRRYDVARRERAEEEEIGNAVEALSRVVNRSLPVKIFVAAMSRQHRTLQQSMMGYFLAWCKHLAALNENQYDARNEASVRVAKKIMTAVDGVTRLPLI